MGDLNAEKCGQIRDVLAPCNLLEVGTEGSELFSSFTVQRLPFKNIPAMFTSDISVKRYQRSPVKWEADTDGCKQLQVACNQLLTSDEGSYSRNGVTPVW